MVNSEKIKDEIHSYELDLKESNPPRLEPSDSSFESLIRPGENVFCIFSEESSELELEKLIRPESDFQNTYESTSKDKTLYIVEGFITIENNDVYLENIKIWDVFQRAEE